MKINRGKIATLFIFTIFIIYLINDFYERPATHSLSKEHGVYFSYMDVSQQLSPADFIAFSESLEECTYSFSSRTEFPDYRHYTYLGEEGYSFVALIPDNGPIEIIVLPYGDTKNKLPPSALVFSHNKVYLLNNSEKIIKFTEDLWARIGSD